MAKRCPSCGYSPIGPFTDNCPICAEPVRNVRSDTGRGGWTGGLSPALKGVLIGVGVAVVLVLGCCGIGLWRIGGFMKDAQQQMEQMQAQAEADRKARTAVVSAADLLREFRGDANAADLKYAGKYLELTGVVERTGRGSRRDTWFVVLDGGDEAAGVKVECHFDYLPPADEARVRRLAKGQTVTVRGEYDGQVSNVQLRECVLVEPPPAGGPAHGP